MANEPIIIIGAGVSGLVLAQYLQKEQVPFHIFERDTDLETRGVGWGLTLHWSLPALRKLLPDKLVARLPEAYVDRAAVQSGDVSRFPFFDLSTGELITQSPALPEWQRIRVSRQKLRELLATGLDIQWGKSFSGLQQDGQSVTALFEDGSSTTGRLLVACDGAQSRVRKELFPEQNNLHEIPVRMIGVKLHPSPEKVQVLRRLDPFFLQGTCSKNDSFVYLSLLEAPEATQGDGSGRYVYQMCISWPYRPGFLGNESPLDVPASQSERYRLLRQIASTWAEQFQSIAYEFPEGEEIKDLVPRDFPPPRTLRSKGRSVLMGDAIHAMAMYRGEGANHSILDVDDFVEALGSKLKESLKLGDLRASLDVYESAVVDRARPGVLASRQACLDAHNWSRISTESPLLTKREMKLQFDESNMIEP
ncbi:unnamed protein product [Clonostachys rhizophaga]|uniref:FAD-binding domain-containing protein n=1 Tax=Clonostachys rhizophaga TaxID=160324 RepID=A0A9N9VQT9_9HYPO|nr:unnamed protein product [Clonostachys rhizophaga]